MPKACVTIDKLLLTMITEKPQLRDLNPETPRAANPEDQLPGCHGKFHNAEYCLSK
ncbi:hypothetical protein DSO57_1035004 [Entomophthora muscae]|uniref:Uncharacterized protein n=1 Tax=Entomophthora muscae TaxID=34485 RepID=A0ACC2SZX9_9FUNG|nr:hypothetical protein DSO57_1035004 [Entomophthora muscae]